MRIFDSRYPSPKLDWKIKQGDSRFKNIKFQTHLRDEPDAETDHPTQRRKQHAEE